MEYLLKASEMKKCDSYTINQIGIPSMVLMERAAQSALDVLFDGSFDLSKVLVVCGGGNNGADGLAMARLLHLKNVKAEVLFLADRLKISKENKQQLKILENYDVNVYDHVDFDSYTAIVDAIFGVGLSRDVGSKYADAIKDMNSARADILSLDIPSGISSDTGQVMGLAVKAKKTMTFAYKKVGLVLYPGAQYAGQVLVKDIGISDIAFDGNYPSIYSYREEDLMRIPARNPYSNKGTYGKLLVIAGGLNMAGAAYFAAKAAYRMGVGLVKLYTVEENRQIIQTSLPEAILSTYQKNNIDIKELGENIAWSDAIVMGPGMGKNEDTKNILQVLLSKSRVPLLIDADGLNVFADDLHMLEDHGRQLVVTPHMGEMARLVKKEVWQIREDLIGHAQNFARDRDLICVVKDARTVVADSGDKVYINQSGNHGMATAGSGDVLAGVIGALLAQGMDIKEASNLGVYIHGLAGDRARVRLGSYSMLAGDILDSISDILKEID